MSGKYNYSYSIYITGVDIIVSCFLNIIISCSSSFPNYNERKYIEGKGESCNICDINNRYYPLTYDNGITKCYKNETKPDGYYLIENNKFEKYHKGCKKCYGSTNNNCLNDNTCLNNVCWNYDGFYYPIKNQINSCYKNESRPDGYYLNSSNSQFETYHKGFIKCYDSTNINCLSGSSRYLNNICCNSLYYPIYNKLNECIKTIHQNQTLII